jgi:ABC-2 type transport system ATP-binding protein
VAFINQGQIVAMDPPHSLKQSFGERALHLELRDDDGELRRETLTLGEVDSGARVWRLLDEQRVVTMHSAEATLEDIFIEFTGRGLA